MATRPKASAGRHQRPARRQPRRQRGEGGVYQRHDHPSCPDLVAGPPTKAGKPTRVRPEHACRGTWVGNLDLGFRDGKRRRKIVYGRTQREALRKLSEAKQQLGTHGDIPTASMTLAQWMTKWLADIAPQTGTPGKMKGYREKTRNYIVPSIGKVRMDKLAPQHVRELHKYVVDTKRLSPSTAYGAHRVLSVALNDAMREGVAARNVASIIRAPQPEKNKGTALSLPEARAVGHQIAGDRLEARWLAALLLGARKGECLGVRWEFVDFDAEVLDLSWQLQHIAYRHDCGTPNREGTWPCLRRFGGDCPDRQLDMRPGYEHVRLEGSICLVRPKTEGSQRVLPLIEPLLTALHERRKTYLAERRRPGYVDYDLVWGQPDGRPIDHWSDGQAWKDILLAAGIPHTRLHSARHTTATLLQAIGVPESTRMMILGHSSVATQRRYAHRDLTLQRKALEELGTTLSLTA